MKRPVSAGFTVVLTTGLLAFGLPALAQERPNPSGGGGEHAVSRPSGGGGGGGGSSAPSGGGSSSVPSGSSMGSAPSSSGGSHRAVPRGGGSRGGGGSRVAGGGSRGGGDHAGAGSTGRRGGEPVVIPVGSDPRRPEDRPGDRAIPGGNYSRPRGERPATGYASPRDISNVPDLGWRRDPYWAYGYWRYSYWTPMYWGPWGGYMYYDPFWSDYYYGYDPYYGGGYQTVYDDGRGALKLKVKPRDAQVYVDGYFSGVVDDFDGVLQKLRLQAGRHRVELRAEGYEAAVFDVLIVEGETVTYRAELKRRP